MNKAEKFIARLDPKQQKIALETSEKILAGKIDGLDIKKLKGLSNKYRIRKGKLRFLYEVDSKGVHTILQVTHRNDTTYNF